MKLAEMGNRLAKNKLEEKLGEPLGVGLFVYCSLQTNRSPGTVSLEPPELSASVIADRSATVTPRLFEYLAGPRM
jgi:hypothetical protein